MLLQRNSDKHMKGGDKMCSNSVVFAQISIFYRLDNYSIAEKMKFHSLNIFHLSNEERK